MTAGIAAVPLAVAALFALAIAYAGRGREAPYARSWYACFLLVAIGWAVPAVAALLGVGTYGAAAQLAWLGAAMLLAQGLRQRRRRRDRGPELVAIWIGIAFVTALLLELGGGEPAALRATVPVLAAVGLLVAAIALGPRRPAGDAGSGGGALAPALLLAGLGAVEVVFAWALLAAPEALAARAALLVGWAVPAQVAAGLVMLLVLNRDLLVALDRLARRDPLTGVWNRRGFDEAAHHLLRRLDGVAAPVAVAIADIDSFKSVNDRFGHTAGDAVLSRFAELLRGAAHHGDLLARLGGEEFALLAIGADGPALVARLEQVRLAMGGLAALDGAGTGALPVTASFGIAELSPETRLLRDALERADRALYEAKRTGRNRSILGEAPF